jgi:hypothetical protein
MHPVSDFRCLQYGLIRWRQWKLCDEHLSYAAGHRHFTVDSVVFPILLMSPVYREMDGLATMKRILARSGLSHELLPLRYPESCLYTSVNNQSRQLKKECLTYFETQNLYHFLRVPHALTVEQKVPHFPHEIKPKIPSCKARSPLLTGLSVTDSSPCWLPIEIGSSKSLF